MQEVKKQQQTGVGLIEKAFQVLDLFQLDAPTWSQAEMVRQTGFNRSTAHRLVRYLTDTRYLVQSISSGRYALGPAALDLGRRADAGFDLRSVCLPAMEKMFASTNESIILTSLNKMDYTAICVEQIVGQRGGLRVFEQVGSALKLHAGAAPKAILASLPNIERDAYLDRDLVKITEHTITKRDQLMEDLTLTRQRGYSLSHEETYDGVAGIGAVILDADDYPLGSLAIALPLQRLTEEKTRSFGLEICSLASEITNSLRLSPENKSQATR
ncbi:MAG: hypothetical protein COB90_07300 [Hyphomicrobiales bacterium]|nr:MAG: hypothetical protein COB90_07300 [Hyphomicrobiales bacterium]